MLLKYKLNDNYKKAIEALKSINYLDYLSERK